MLGRASRDGLIVAASCRIDRLRGRPHLGARPETRRSGPAAAQNGDSAFDDPLYRGIGARAARGISNDGHSRRGRDTGGSPPAGQDETGRAIGRDVERDLHLEPPTGAEQMDALVGLELRRADEVSLAAVEVEHRRRQRIRAERRVPHHRDSTSVGSPAKNHRATLIG